LTCSSYELLALAVDGIPEEQRQKIDYFMRGLVFFRNREFDNAITSFTHALEIDPDDKPSHLYIERSRHYIDTPPPPDWNGVFVMKTK
jgi:tetratricopeptide (TPR) repeat protein